ncbi:putative deoxyribonuclease RhsB [Gammaproteobacteria bacterium]|nr:putative deoxyribonuclease RhsB [Gammaproteobacteria bacterium]
MGVGWTHSYSSRLTFAGGTPNALVTASGYVEPLVSAQGGSGIYVSQTGSGNRVVAGSGGEWVLHTATGEREEFHASGRLLRKVSTDGLVTALTYSGERLDKVTGPFGHSLILHYDPDSLLIDRITDPVGHDINYQYSAGNGLNRDVVLTRVTYQDMKYREYLYEDANSPLLLTSIKDETGIQYAAFTYDSAGRVTQSEHNGGVGRVTLVYDDVQHTTTVTDAGGIDTVFAFSSLESPAGQWTWTLDGIAGSYSSLVETLAVIRAREPGKWWNVQPSGIGQFVAPSGSGKNFRKVISGQIAGEGASFAYTTDYARRTDSVTDERGNRTKYGYDTYHRRTVTEADQDATGLYKRTTTTDYLEDTSDLPVLVTTPSVTGGGNSRAVTTTYLTGTRLVETVSVSGYDPAQPGVLLERTTTFSDYNADGVPGSADDKQPGAIDGPRTGGTDVILLDYWDESFPGVACTTTPGGACGQIKSMTNAAGHLTTFDAYYPDGRLQQMTDPNDVVTTYTYDLRGRLDTVTETPPTGASRVTNYDYDDAGQLDKVTLPNDQYLDYTWTNAHLLDYVTDNAGNKIDYSYDLRGNRTGESMKDASGALKKSLAMVYDVRNRLDTLQEGTRPAADLTFDAAGLLEGETDSGGQLTDYDYDPLHRLRKAIDAVNGTSAPTEYGYNVHDDLTSVEAPNGAATSYIYDDLGNLRKEASPDRGTTLYGYDAAGNMTCRADGRNTASALTCETVTARAVYTFDGLNRVTSIDYTGNGPSIDVSFQWDSRPGSSTQAGRLRQVVHHTGFNGNTTVTRKMDYDAWGNVTWSEQTVAGNGATRTLTTQYEYDGNNQIKKITYPSGRVVNYTRSANGRITAISATFQGNTETVVSNGQYYPFGPVRTFWFGNGLVHQTTRDTAYAPYESYLASSSSPYPVFDAVGYTVDDAGNIEAIEDWINSANSRSYDYDGLDRLTWDSGVSSASPSYSYDGNGNRLTRTGNVGGMVNQTFTFPPGSNRIATYQAGSGSAIAVQHDDMGNVLDDGQGRVYEYGHDARMSLIFWTPASTGMNLEYNGLGELARSRKVTYDACTGNELLLSQEYFSFTPDGRALQILSENNSRTETDIVWLDGQPVAQFLDSYDAQGIYQGTEVTYLHTDQLGTPRLGTDENQVITWRWQSEAFGSTGPTGSAAVRLRFPGQIHLGLAQVTYNYYRDYFAQWGRYLESDPVGQYGGPNTYGYTQQNPLNESDPLGLLFGNPFKYFSPQEKGCDLVGEGNECTRKCCDAHDQCYEANRCNMWSWLFTGGINAGVQSPCTRCNAQVVVCYVRSYWRCEPSDRRCSNTDLQ